MTRLLVLRHAPTDWNAARLIQGRTDRELNDAGRALAKRWRLPEGWEGAVCYSSPLRRAMETATILGLSPKAEARLIEMDWGEWEGRSIADLRDAMGGAMAENEARGLDFRPPGGESPRDVQERLLPLLRTLSGPTIFVTHKGVIRPLYAMASGWAMHDDPPEKLRDGCAHCFRVGADGTPSVEELNIPLAAAS